MFQANSKALDRVVAASLGEFLQQKVVPATPRHSSKSGEIGIRSLDVAGALALLVFFAPLLLIVAFLVKIHDGGPALFAHRRIGRNGETFFCYKFRSMVMGADVVLANVLANDPGKRMEWMADHKLRNDPRITKLGRLLRKSSLDELPQLLNVLRGEMSLVGPRPIVAEEAIRYGRWLEYYCATRPGITGLWQVSGRNNLSYRRRVACDVLYARNQSLMLNLKIAIRTIPAVLSQTGSH
jgi:exopolysaccharide production protein ExoY